MGRPPRPNEAGGTYHVTMRGNRGQDIFRDDQDRRTFLAQLERLAGTHGWNGWSWCLMTNHVHICLTTQRPNLSQGMRDLFGQYARFFHWKAELSDHLFHSRFHSVEVTDERQLLAVVRYSARNPVRAHLSERAVDYPWSSIAAVVSDQPPEVGFIDPGRILRLVHHRPAHARLLLRKMVELPDPADHEAHPVDLPGAVAIAQVLEPRMAAPLLNERGLSVREIARLIGTPRGTVTHWLSRPT